MTSGNCMRLHELHGQPCCSVLVASESDLLLHTSMRFGCLRPKSSSSAIEDGAPKIKSIPPTPTAGPAGGPRDPLPLKLARALTAPRPTFLCRPSARSLASISLTNTNTCIIRSLPQFVPYLPPPITLVIHIDRVHANRMIPRPAMVRNTIPGAFLSPFTGSLLPQAC